MKIRGFLTSLLGPIVKFIILRVDFGLGESARGYRNSSTSGLQSHKRSLLI